MVFLRKHSTVITWIALLSTFFASRLINLTILPLFTDESIYIYWAKVIADTHAQWFISLTDGKPPLLIWMISSLLTILPHDLFLVAGRLPSVFAGGISLLAIGGVTYELFKSKRAAVISGILYILSPYMLFYDRMALFDSLLSAMLLVCVYFMLRTIRTQTVRDSILWGIFLGLAFLSKPTAIVFLGLTPVCFYLLSDIKQLKKNIKKAVLLPGIAVIIGEGINNLQRLSSVYFLMDRKNQQFQQPLSEILKDPFGLTLGNLNGFISWLIPYYTLPLFLFGLLATVFLLQVQWRKGLMLVVLWIAPIIALSTFGREIFPRYALFTTPYFLIICAFFLNYLWESAQNKVTKVGVAVLFLSLIVLPLRFDYYLLTDPIKAPFPGTDYNQYVSEHPSGYGVEKVISFIDEEKKKGKVTLVTQGTFGLYPYAFDLTYWDDTQVEIIPRWPLSVVDQELIDKSKKGNLYILLKEHETIPPTLPLELVMKIEKPGGKYPLLLTKIKSEK